MKNIFLFQLFKNFVSLKLLSPFVNYKVYIDFKSKCTYFLLMKCENLLIFYQQQNNSECKGFSHTTSPWLLTVGSQLRISETFKDALSHDCPIHVFVALECFIIHIQLQFQMDLSSMADGVPRAKVMLSSRLLVSQRR